MSHWVHFKKIFKCVGVILKTRMKLNKSLLLNLYCSFAYSYFIYCNHVWGNTYPTNLKKILYCRQKNLLESRHWWLEMSLRWHIGWCHYNALGITHLGIPGQLDISHDHLFAYHRVIFFYESKMALTRFITSMNVSHSGVIASVIAKS